MCGKQHNTDVIEVTRHLLGNYLTPEESTCYRRKFNTTTVNRLIVRVNYSVDTN